MKKRLLLWIFNLFAGSVLAGTAAVQVWIKDAATGKTVRNAHLMVLNGADTVAAASSKITAPTAFSLSVPSSAVDAGVPERPGAFGMVEAFPNPCIDRVTLTFGGPAVRLRIFNVLGQEVHSSGFNGAWEGSTAVDLLLRNAPNGVYLVRITDCRGVSAAGKFLKIGPGAASVSPGILAAGIRPAGARQRSPVFHKTDSGTPYTFTAFTSKDSKDADGSHVVGFATSVVPVSKDTTIELFLQKTPFSECGHNAAPRAPSPVIVDGVADEPAWEQAEWGPINKLWLGDEPSAGDFSGRYKLVWTPERLFLLAEIRDDLLSDQIEDPFTDYYKDDCLEMFVDEDASGGDHMLDYNAFAYHIAIDGHAMDLGPNYKAMDFSSHLDVQWTQKGDVTMWEVGLKVYGDTYNDRSTANVPVNLAAGKIMGFMIAYCDNDGTFDRESFIGSIDIPGQDKNQGWINAGVFGTLELLP